VSIWVEIKCNNCNRAFGESEYYTRDNISKLKTKAKEAGWIVSYKGNVICPECQNKLGMVKEVVKNG